MFAWQPLYPPSQLLSPEDMDFKHRSISPWGSLRGSWTLFTAKQEFQFSASLPVKLQNLYSHLRVSPPHFCNTLMQFLLTLLWIMNSQLPYMWIIKDLIILYFYLLNLQMLNIGIHLHIYTYIYVYVILYLWTWIWPTLSYLCRFSSTILSVMFSYFCYSITT